MTMTFSITVPTKVAISSLAVGDFCLSDNGIFLILDPANLPSSPGNVWNACLLGTTPGNVPGGTYASPGDLMVYKGTVTTS